MNHIDRQHQSANPDPELNLTAAGTGNHIALHTSDARRKRKNDGKVKEVTMNVLNDQRERLLTTIMVRGSPTAQDGGSAQKAL